MLHLATLSLSLWSRFRSCLISERKDGIDEEHRPVDDGQRALGDGQAAALGLEAAFPGLQDQDTGRDEHGASEQAEEQVDLLVDRVAQEMTCHVGGRSKISREKAIVFGMLEKWLIILPANRPIRMME